MSLNIIVKGKNPPWRPLQSKLGHFKSLHKKDDTKVNPSLSVGEMFSREERKKIDNAAIATNMMGINFSKGEEEELRKEAEETSRIISDPGFIKFY